jgi:ABC-2 type transport system ATP-binding protein
LVKNTSVKNLLQGLNKEVFIFDTSAELPAGFNIKNFNIEKIDEHSFELQVDKGQTLNDVFSALSGQGISIISMRNKANRLEEMFVSMIAQSAANKSEGA